MFDSLFFHNIIYMMQEFCFRYMQICIMLGEVLCVITSLIKEPGEYRCQIQNRY